VEITKEERDLLLELIESAEETAIQGMDHADIRTFKDVLRKQLDLLETVREKLRADGAHAA
jgi:predicted oxidoreductase